MRTYNIPDVLGTMLIGSKTRSHGTLRDLLKIYATLPVPEQEIVSILLEKHIPTPPCLQDLGHTGTRMNIFDGEGARLLAYL